MIITQGDGGRTHQRNANVCLQEISPTADTSHSAATLYECVILWSHTTKITPRADSSTPSGHLGLMCDSLQPLHKKSAHLQRTPWSVTLWSLFTRNHTYSRHLSPSGHLVWKCDSYAVTSQEITPTAHTSPHRTPMTHLLIVWSKIIFMLTSQLDVGFTMAMYAIEFCVDPHSSVCVCFDDRHHFSCLYLH